jgi:aspartyl/asparaginyl-tRNA synthetase
MIDNKLWTQTNKSELELLDRTMENYYTSLETFQRSLDRTDFNNHKDLKKSIHEINYIIFEEVLNYLKNNKIDFNTMFKNKFEKDNLTVLDCFKLFICSEEIFHFWNIPFTGLKKFYFENLKKDKSLTVDLYIGRLQELFDTLSDEEFERFEKYIIFTSKIDT